MKKKQMTIRVEEDVGDRGCCSSNNRKSKVSESSIIDRKNDTT